MPLFHDVKKYGRHLTKPHYYKPFKVIVAGTRTFDDYELVEKHLDFLLQNRKEVQIVSGGARGADALGERYGYSHKCMVKVFPANWDKYGKSAGYKRNEEMAQYADACIVFWDGESRGTKHMIDLATKYGLKLKVVKYKNPSK